MSTGELFQSLGAIEEKARSPYLVIGDQDITEDEQWQQNVVV